MLKTSIFKRGFKIVQNVVKTFKNASEFQKSSNPDKYIIKLPLTKK